MIDRIILYLVALAALAAFLCTGVNVHAYEYSACPDAAQVEDAWWNPAACEGGMYSYGSLYFRWARAPTGNGTVELRSVSLLVRTRSKGTDLYISVWNGYSWSTLAGGRVDFLGNYVYDLTRIFPGAYADGSYRIKISNNGIEEMRIEQLVLYIEYESRFKILTVLVKDCGTGKVLKDVDVTVGSETAETGNDGIAGFNVLKGDVYEVRISDENYEAVSERVYVEGNSDIEICTKKKEVPGVDVSDLDIESDAISFYIANTGNFDGYITYYVYMDDALITQSSIFLDESEEERITLGYEIPPGRHRITAKAVSGDREDSEDDIRCVSGTTENYACRGNDVIREVIDDGCSSRWEVMETCEEGCIQGCCTAGGQILDNSAAACRAEISSLDYADNIPAGISQNLGVTLRNTGKGTRNFIVRLYVDGAQHDSKTVRIGEGSTNRATFSFSMQPAGAHNIKIEAVACGRVSDSLLQNIRVLSTQSVPVDGGHQQPPVTDDDDNDGAGPSANGGAAPVISIQADPLTIQSAPCKGTAVLVRVESSVDTSYDIDVAGLSSEHIDYPSKVSVSGGTGSFFVYINAPSAEGNYSVRIRVRKGQLYDESDVMLTVSKSAGDGIGSPAGRGQDPLTGFLMYAQSEWIVFAVIGIVILAVFIAFFTRFFLMNYMNREQKWDNYDFRLLEDEYSQNVRRVALQ